MPENADKRLSVIETQLPSLIESRLWLIAGGLGVIGLVAMAIAKLVFK